MIEYIFLILRGQISPDDVCYRTSSSRYLCARSQTTLGSTQNSFYSMIKGGVGRKNGGKGIRNYRS